MKCFARSMAAKLNLMLYCVMIIIQNCYSTEIMEKFKKFDWYVIVLSLL